MSVSRRLTLITNGVSFVITLTVFLFVYLIKWVSLEVGFLIAVAIYITIVAIAFVDVKYQLHRAVLGPLRKYLRYVLASVVIEKWSEQLVIDDEGNGDLIHEIHGKVNFGLNKWISLGIGTQSDQPDKESFPIKIINMDDNSPIEPDFLVDYPRYKKIRIPFGRELDRGKKFNLKIAYTLDGTFNLGCEDHHSHHAFHYEKAIDMSITLPDNCRVLTCFGEIVTEHGDVRGKQSPPEKVSENFITWQISQAMHGDNHKLSWTTGLR